MDNRLFSIDPYAATSYGLYNSVKKKEGSFVDFLLHYDSQGVSEGDNSWLTKMIGNDNLNNPEIAKTLSFANINTFDMLNSQSYFDTQVSAYKLQLQSEAAKRGVKLPNVDDISISLYM